MNNPFIQRKEQIKKIGKVCLLICAIVSVLYQQRLPQTSYGIPALITEPIDIDRCKFLQIVDDGSYLYILSSKPSGCILVFDLEGNYRCAHLVDHGSKGELQLAADKGTLYVADTQNNIYIFENNEYVEFVPKQKSEDLWMQNDFGKTHEVYDIRFVSVWRKDIHGDVCVIQRSAYAMFAQYHLHIFTMFFLGVGMAFYFYKRRTKK